MGFTAAAIGVGVAGAAASAGTGAAAAGAQKSAAKKGIKSTERLHEASAADREKASQMVRADQQIAQQNLLAGEQTRLNILGALGSPGSYGPTPGSRTGPISLDILAPTGVEGISGGRGSLTASGRRTESGVVTSEDVKLRGKSRFHGKRAWEVEGPLLDPDAITAEVKGTAGFRTVSRMVAEAEQMMNRTGPLWNQLNNSVVGGIYESNASFQREAMEQMSRNLARGGSARRVGLQMAQAFQVQERVNRQRTGQLWQAKVGLEEYRLKYAQEATSFAQSWTSNHAGIRDGFTNALNNLQMFWASTMAPTLAGATTAAQSVTQQGIMQGTAGLMAASQTKSQAIAGATDAMIGLSKTAISGIGGGGTSTGGAPGVSYSGGFGG